MNIPSIKLPIFQSPGLIIHPSMGMSYSSGTLSSTPQQAATASTTTTGTTTGGGVTSGSTISTYALHSEKTSPANIFTNAMKNVGYIFPSFSTTDTTTLEEKSKVVVELTHPGSSTVRSVQDIFDRWIPGKEAKRLLPNEFYQPVSPEGEMQENEESKKESESEQQPSILNRFMNALTSYVEEVNSSSSNEVTSDMENESSSSCSYTPQSFREMLPISLTTPLPEEYIAQYQLYVRDVQLREQCIRDHQNQYNEYQHAKDKYEEQKRQKRKHKVEEEDNDNDEEPPIAEPESFVEIPPIPEPPSVSDCEQEEVLLPPMHLVKHLDYPSFFQSKTSLYYNLMSNNIADPQYVGANAPGLLGLIHLLSGNTQDGAFYSSVPSYASGGPGSSKEKGALVLPPTGKGKKTKGKKVKQESGTEGGTDALSPSAATVTAVAVASDAEIAW